MPNPPVNLRPRSLTVTDIEKLVRSPYELYAKYVLRLLPIDALGADADLSERGTLIHKVMANWAESGSDPAAPDALETFLTIADGVFIRLETLPARRAVWRHRLAVQGENFLAFEAGRAARLAWRKPEIDGSWSFPVEDAHFTLRGRADRIDRMKDGSYEILDFKTGSVPTPAEMKQLLAPQLLAEAKLVAEGGFAPDLPAGPVSALTYLRLPADPMGFEQKPFTVEKGASIEETVEALFARLQRSLATYMLRETPLAPDILPKKKPHLCRRLRSFVAPGGMGGRGRGGGRAMSERPVAPTPEITRRQTDAADPENTVWVSANAGSGKTHVLTQRVLRLLLTGVSPAEILCLTYTKAAAAEMRARVTSRLGAWAVSAEDALSQELQKLTGLRPDAATHHRARTLFAHALDTPGGLKINTIHAFCESVLHRFPLEAGVPFGFTVIEDAERERLIRLAREKVLASGLGGKRSGG